MGLLESFETFYLPKNSPIEEVDFVKSFSELEVGYSFIRSMSPFPRRTDAKRIITARWSYMQTYQMGKAQAQQRIRESKMIRDVDS